MRGVFLIIFLFCQVIVFSQQINTADETFRVNQLVFNDEFIKLYKIKEIKAANTTKKDGQPLKIGKEYYYWQFDSEGRTIGEGKTIENTLTKVPDTLHNIMRFNKNHNLSYRTEKIGKRIKSYHFKYNSDGTLRESNMKERLNYGDSPPFIASIDSFSYQTIADTTLIKRTFNEDGANYREQLYIYDNEKRITEKNGRYLRGDVRTKEVYKYNIKGMLSEKIIYDDVQKNQYETYKLQYDGLGNINKINTYRENENKRIIDFVYFDNSILLKAIIFQDVETHDLNILKFEYKYSQSVQLEN